MVLFVCMDAGIPIKTPYVNYSHGQINFPGQISQALAIEFFLLFFFYLLDTHLLPIGSTFYNFCFHIQFACFFGKTIEGNLGQVFLHSMKKAQR